jgi:hypothetical protein
MINPKIKFAPFVNPKISLPSSQVPLPGPRTETNSPISFNSIKDRRQDHLKANELDYIEKDLQA